MPLQNYQYDTIMREYSKTQSQNRRILEERTQEIYKKIPRIREIDEEVATLSAKKARALLSGESSGLEDLKAAISLLSQERNALLVCNSYPEDYLELPYKCPVCQDTGYVGSQKCTCFKKAEIELLYTQSNLKEILKKENFDHFSFDYYSDTMKNEATGLTERETARRAYDIARGFVRNFDGSFENLFLTVIPVWVRLFFLTVLLMIFWNQHIALCTFPHLICLNCWQTPNSPEIKQKDRNLYLTAIC